MNMLMVVGIAAQGTEAVPLGFFIAGFVAFAAGAYLLAKAPASQPFHLPRL